MTLQDRRDFAHAQVQNGVRSEAEEVPSYVAELPGHWSREFRDLRRGKVCQQPGGRILVHLEHVTIAVIAMGRRAYNAAHRVRGRKSCYWARGFNDRRAADFPSTHQAVE